MSQVRSLVSVRTGDKRLATQRTPSCARRSMKFGGFLKRSHLVPCTLMYHRLFKTDPNSTRLNPIYSRAGGSTISYVHSYQVRNTLLRINYLTCLVSTMASSGFGPYHGMLLEDAQTKCVIIIPTPWSMTHVLGLVQFPPQHE